MSRFLAALAFGAALFSQAINATPAGPIEKRQCQNLLIEDFVSQSRLTFLQYNALTSASSDDQSMQSIVVGNPNRFRARFTPRASSYWYTTFDCVDASTLYGGISFRINAPSGTNIYIEMQSSQSCGAQDDLNIVGQSSGQLGWTFDGTERLYSIPFSRFQGLARGRLVGLVISGMNNPVTFGPMSFYCGNTPSEYRPPTVTQPSTPSGTVAITSATASPILIDTFARQDSNNLGQWHGADEGLNLQWGSNRLTINPTTADASFYTQVTDSCRDLRSLDRGYLHIQYSGSNQFSVALEQHNSQCNPNAMPFPETWDSVEAARYTTSQGNIYIPMSHFNINRQRVTAVVFKGFYTTSPTTLTRVEIVRTVPSGTRILEKLPSGRLVFACSRPNSFAFAIDDGIPGLAQQVLEIVREENIQVTFFTVGLPLDDASTNLTNVYREMQRAGHQIALHSYTHPPMESPATNWDIDWEIDNDLRSMQRNLGIQTSKYFRPPFGNEGARMRQRLAARLPDAHIMNWSVDVEDWRWAESDTPERQLDAFREDVQAGGNLVVMHYLYPSTVSYLRQFIQIARDTGRQLMRVDQCMEDPDAPPL